MGDFGWGEFGFFEARPEAGCLLVQRRAIAELRDCYSTRHIFYLFARASADKHARRHCYIYIPRHGPADKDLTF